MVELNFHVRFMQMLGAREMIPGYPRTNQTILNGTFNGAHYYSRTRMMK